MKLPRVSILAAGIALLVSGCGGGSGGDEGDPPGGEPFGLTERVAVQGLAFPSGLPEPRPLRTRRRFPNLSFDEPVFIAAPPDGRNRLCVLEKTGRMYIFSNDDAVDSAEVFLDLTDSVNPSGEGGLLGLAFHPDYASNGLFHLYYTTGDPFRSRISRFRRSGDPDRADSSSEDVLLEFPQPFSNHNAGMLAFGPDGKLYIASGDGGSGNDPQNNAQNLGNLLGKILRIEPDGDIPADNPFTGVAGARGEIWAYGLRNPWRFSFDRNLGTLWLADVGQSQIEEIDIIVRGGNYGWRIYEGNRSNLNPDGLPRTAFEQPVLTYDHTVGVSITGGYVYRGARLAGFHGAYFYADFSSGRIWALVHDDGRAISTTQVASLTTPVSFGEDEAGELFLVSFRGTIHDLVPESPAPDPPFPDLLSETGLFDDLATLTPAPGLIEYEVNSPLWSDGARKRRWIALPGLQTIDFDAAGPWTFPVGTVLVKHFEIDTGPATVLRLETRVLVHHADGWQGYTYRWREDETDADLLADAASARFTVSDGAGGEEERSWYFPSRTDCLRCHTGAAGWILGVRTAQLNRTFDYPMVADNQLRAWNHIGLFGRNIGDAAAYPALADPLDPTAETERRARSYLDANCAMCHLPGGPAPGDLDLRAETPLAGMHAVGVVPSGGDLGIAGARIIQAGDRESSVLWERLRRLDPTRMPPLASLEVDDDAVDLIGDWIDGLEPR
jgi:uncharacterized repeat protein (TIGR03806 family)